jgi:hypothetical protein
MLKPHIKHGTHIWNHTTDMDIIKTYKKGKHLNILEKYHTYKISKHNLHTNDTYIDTHNPLFRTMQEMNTS